MGTLLFVCCLRYCRSQYFVTTSGTVVDQFFPVISRSTVVHSTSVLACMGHHLSSSSAGFRNAQSSVQSCSSCVLLISLRLLSNIGFAHPFLRRWCASIWLQQSGRPLDTYDLRQRLSACIDNVHNWKQSNVFS